MKFSCLKSIIGKILKSLIIYIDFENLTENYCIPHKHRLIDQTTKQTLSNFEPQNPIKYKHNLFNSW